MLSKIKQLEQMSSGLEPSATQRVEMTTLAVDYAESFLGKLPTMNTFGADKGRSRLLEQAFGEQAEDMAGLLELLDTAVIHEGINAASGGHMGYIPGGGIYPSSLGDFLADVIAWWCKNGTTTGQVDD